MNKDMYRLVWNSRLGAPQVVSEAAQAKTSGGSNTTSSPRARKKTAWPLALLTLGMASTAMAVPGGTVITGADSGVGSLRAQLAIGGLVYVDPAVKSISLSSDILGFSGPMAVYALDALSITGGSLVGNNFSLSLNGASSQQRLSTTISGAFKGEGGGNGGTAASGSAGVLGSGSGIAGTDGSDGTYTAPGTQGAAAITGSNFDITNNADVFGGQGTASIAPGAGGDGGIGGAILSGMGTGGAGGAGGAGASGGSGSAGGAGIAATQFSVVNNALIQGGNGSTGVSGGNGGRGGNGGNGQMGGTGKYGGSGGRGGNAGNGGNGGAGGAGISGSNMVIVNKGTIQGGNGGAAGDAGTAGLGGTGGTASGNGPDGQNGTAGLQGVEGQGGAGIVATGNSIIRNTGTIAGGNANDGLGSRANAIELSGGNNTLVLEAGSQIYGNVISTGSVNDLLVLGGDNNTGATTFDLSQIGTGGSSTQYQGFSSFEKQGSNTWTLQDEDTYGKDWTVRSGTLVLDDLASLKGSVNVLKDAVFSTGSNGQIAKNLVNNGHVAIGSTASPYAQLIVDGEYSQGSTGTLRINAQSDSQYSSLYVDGNVHLNGTLDVNVKSGNTLAIGNQLGSVISTDGTITGVFSDVTDNSLLFDFTAIYNTTRVDLDVMAAKTGGGTGGSNTVSGSAQAMGNTQGRGAAAVIDGVIGSNPTGALAVQFMGLSTQAQVSRALSEALPMVGGSTTAATTALSSINQVVQARNGSSSGLSSGDEVMTEKHLWIKPFGSWARQGSSGGAPGMRSNVGGMALGLDGSFTDQLTLGAAFIYATADTRNTGNSPRQSLDTDVYQLVGYGTYRLNDASALRFQVDGGQNRNDGTRDVAFTGLQAKSSYNTWTAHAGVALDHTINLSQSTRFTPSVRADYTWIKNDAYTENGAGALNLKAKSSSAKQFVLGVDGKLVHEVTDQLSLSGNLGVGYDFLADRNAIVTTFAGAPGSAFTTYGGDKQRWLVHAGAKLSYKVNRQLQMTVRYDVEKRTEYLNQTASAELRWAF